MPQWIPEEADTTSDAVCVDLILADRYRVVRTLKEGRGTKTFLATDLSQGDTVVVKAVSAEHRPEDQRPLPSPRWYCATERSNYFDLKKSFADIPEGSATPSPSPSC